MAVFAYKALDPEQASVQGTVAAESPRQARDQLRARGLAVQTLQPLKGAGSQAFWTRLLNGRLANQWSMAIHELAMLLHAGIPLLESLDTLARQHKGRFRTAILAVRERVASGSSLAEAMGERPDLFDPLSVHLVEVGENSGTLETVLEQLADFKQRFLQLKDRILTALMYPMFLVVFGLAATIFLMTFVMPPLLENLQETMDELPWPTQVVKACSDVLLNYGWLLLLLTVVAGALGVAAVQTERGKRAWHCFLLNLPLIGPLVLKQGISRIAMVISTLTRSGVVLTKAIELAAKSTPNVILREALEACGRQVGEGRDLADALDTGVFPPLALQIFAVGQESGRLDEMLERIAGDYDRQVATRSARLAALLEPVLIIVLATLVGFVLLATILPILEAGNVLE